MGSSFVIIVMTTASSFVAAEQLEHLEAMGATLQPNPLVPLVVPLELGASLAEKFRVEGIIGPCRFLKQLDLKQMIQQGRLVSLGCNSIVAVRLVSSSIEVNLEVES